MSRVLPVRTESPRLYSAKNSDIYIVKIRDSSDSNGGLTRLLCVSVCRRGETSLALRFSTQLKLGNSGPWHYEN